MWGDLFKQIVGRLKSVLSSEFEHVYVGRQVAPTAFPCVYILPQEVRMQPASAKSTMYEMVVRLRTISREVVSEEAVKTSTDLIGKIESMLIVDRSFGGLVDNLEVDRIAFAVERPISRDRQETELVVRFIRIM